jgi:elongation factor P hydroxylase
LAADLVPEEVPVESFRDLDEAVWASEPMTVREVLGHTRRILDADLTYPIIVSADGWIMDGCHRLAKAMLEGRSTILRVKFKVNPTPDGREDGT